MVITVRSSESNLNRSFQNMSLAEIQKAIEELAPEEQEELRNWFNAYDPAIDREWAAIAQERIRQIKSGEVAPLDGEQVLKEMRQLAKQLAQE
jgi:Putative addiction module component